MGAKTSNLCWLTDEQMAWLQVLSDIVFANRNGLRRRDTLTEHGLSKTRLKVLERDGRVRPLNAGVGSQN